MAQLESTQLKLLVVDDESDNLDLLYRTFRHDFKVFRANSAPNALAVLEQEGEMAIIISDQRMPKMKGTELLSRTVEQFPDTIRIVLTGYTDVEDLVDAINTGKVFKYITKPWNPTELKNVVQQASETYRAIKRRTNELHRALRRESVFNAMITAIRESLDYRQILETTVETLGRTLEADVAVLIPVDSLTDPAANPPYRFGLEKFVYQASSSPDASSAADASSAGEVYSRFHSQGEYGSIGGIKPESRNHRFDSGSFDQQQTDQEPCRFDAAQASFETPTQAPFPASEPQLNLNELLDSAPLVAALQQRQIQRYVLEQSHRRYTLLVVPLVYQQEPLAVLSLFKVGTSHAWTTEEQQLVSDVAEQAALAISQARLYQQIQEQTEQMRDELKVAQRIQSHLLCQSMPQIRGIRVQACCYPAREVGGDFFEVYDHPNGDVWLAVGDVSGKGVPAALFMSSTLSVLRRELAQESSPYPHDVLGNLNSNLFDGLVGSNCFITIALARYTPTTRELVYANAGHILPMIWPATRQESRSRSSVQNSQMVSESLSEKINEPQYLKTRGVPLGILPRWVAQSETLVLGPGYTFLLASDGITEARVSPDWLRALRLRAPEASQCQQPEKAMNGEEATAASNPSWGDRDYPMLRQQGLWHLLQQHPTLPPLEAVLAKIQAHSLGQEDDQTILSMEIL